MNANPAKFNEVQRQAIHHELITKEMREFKVYDNYSINPFKKTNYLAGKPNSVHDAEELLKGQEDEHFLQVISRANLEPTKKYNAPQTENQEYGWITKPLVEHDKNDARLNFLRKNCEITAFMNEFWKQNHPKRASPAKPT